MFTFLISDVVVVTISYELNQIGWGLGILAPSPGLVESNKKYMALEAKMLKLKGCKHSFQRKKHA